jgi:hypothetical protein
MCLHYRCDSQIGQCDGGVIAGSPICAVISTGGTDGPGDDDLNLEVLLFAFQELQRKKIVIGAVTYVVAEQRQSPGVQICAHIVWSQVDEEHWPAWLALACG